MEMSIAIAQTMIVGVLVIAVGVAIVSGAQVVHRHRETKRQARARAAHEADLARWQFRRDQYKLQMEAEVVFDKIFLGENMPLDSQATCGCDSSMIETRIENMARKIEQALGWPSDKSADCMDRLNAAIGAMLNEYQTNIKAGKLAKQCEQLVFGEQPNAIELASDSDDFIMAPIDDDE